MDRPRGDPLEVLAAFTKLGLTSFGGPVAHIGYFRREFVERRAWLDDTGFARVLALCQFLPGPASSQMGFSLGLLRAGWSGAFAAFVAFTLPSALLMFAFATALPALGGAAGQAVIHGLKLVAVAVVAQGVMAMSRQLCPDAPRASIAVIAAALVLVSGRAWMQLVVVAGGALAGLVACRRIDPPQGQPLSPPYGARTASVLLMAFFVLLFGLPLIASAYGGLSAVIEAFYRAGALVFGGGHVVLPLLRETVVTPGWVSSDDFLAGYGAAQAVPGPMFSFASYLGARMFGGDAGAAGAVVALLSIFAPGLLLVSGALPLWRAIADHPQAGRAVAGVNAAVVGLLGAALYDPVWLSAVRGPVDVAIAAVGFVMLAAWRASPLLVVLWCVVASLGLALA
jgi:chromate transporter